MSSVTINGKEYLLSPLRMKYLKQLANVLSTQRSTNMVDVFTFWNKFIVASIQDGGSPDFNEAELDELTPNELMDTWNKVKELSGITIGPKGERTPSAPTGDTSTAASA